MKPVPGRRASALVPSLIVSAVLLATIGFAVSAVVERATVGRKLAQVQSDMRTYALALEAYNVDWQAYPPTMATDLVKQAGGPVSLRPLETELIRLSTPVAYMTDALLPEPFNWREVPSADPDNPRLLWFLFRGWDVVNQGGPPPRGSLRQPLYLYFSNPVDPLQQQLLAQMYAALAPPAYLTVTAQGWRTVVGKKWAIVSPGSDGFFQADSAVFVSGGDIISSYVVQQVEITLPAFNGVYDPNNGLVSHGDIVRFQGTFTPTPTPLAPLTPRPEDNGAHIWTAYD